MSHWAALVFHAADRYMTGMSPAIGFLIFLATVLAMEGFAYVMHRWVMHGPGWFLHESHHRPRTGNWELNDLYAAIFAVPSSAASISLNRFCGKTGVPRLRTLSAYIA